MKHWFKKSAAIAMSAVMALSLAACASSKPATPEEVLQAASEKVPEHYAAHVSHASAIHQHLSGRDGAAPLTKTVSAARR